MNVTKGVRTANKVVEPIVLTDTMAYVRSNIVAVNEPGTDDTPGFVGFMYDETEYSKDEFITMQAQQTSDLSATVDDLLVIIPAIATGGIE